MVRQSKVGGKASSAGRRSCFAVLVIVILMIWIMGPSSKGPEMDDNLRSGQAQHSTSSSTAQHIDVEDAYQNESEEEEEVDASVEAAIDDIKSAEEKEIAKSKGALSAAIETAGDFARIGLKKIFGTATDVTEEDINEMVDEVEKRLTDDVNKELQSKADSLVEKEKDELTTTVERDEENGYFVESIEEDVHHKEAQAIHNVKTEIDETTAQIRKAMLEKTQELEKQILEERLSKRLGKKVKLVIIEDEITGVDELLDDLTALRGGDPSESGAGKPDYSTTPNAGTQTFGSPGAVKETAQGDDDAIFN